MPEAMELTTLKARDRVLLYLDRRNQPLHVACLSLLTPPQNAAADFVDSLMQRLRAAAPPSPPFNRRLERRYGGDWWVGDADIDLDQHLVHLTLPQPGQIKDLMALVSRLHAFHLDRSFPLWRMYLIEGLSDGRIAIYLKMHYALGKDIGGTRQMLQSMSTDPHESLPPVWALPGNASRRSSSRDFTPARSAAFAARLLSGMAAVSGVLADARRTAHDVKQGYAEVVGGRQAPACILNQRISATREFAARSFGLPRIQDLCRAYACTTQDMVLSLCATALRRLLKDRNALPEAPLIALVPMTVPGDERDADSQTLPLLVNLGTELADPVERLRIIRRSREHGRARNLGISAGEAYAYTLATSGFGLLKLMLRPAGGRLPFNLVISQAASPETPMKSPLYWQGCKLEGLYPLPVLIDGQALNITYTQRGESLDFGVLACARTLPRVERLLAYLEDALTELESRTPQPTIAPDDARKRLARVPSDTGVPVYNLNARRTAGSRVAKAQAPAGRVKAPGLGRPLGEEQSA